MLPGRAFDRLRAKRGRGFTLIEVLVAAMVLGVAIVGALGAFSATMRALGVAEFDSAAARLGQAKMAEVRALDELPLGESSGDFGEDNPGFTWSLNIEPVGEETGLQGLYQIELTITGRAGGRAREATFTTYTL
jgi:prepilin-type N-terminal cleavage/methylation domain-containing protein